MDRKIVYTGAIPQDLDILDTNKNTMTAIGMALQMILGTGTWLDGLNCTPTGPASMQVLVSQGSITTLANVDGTAYGSIGSDTTHQIVKQGITPLGNTTFTLTAPVTTGQSVVYLIQGEYQDVDAGSVVLPYYSASNPAVAYNGPANSGVSQNTTRKGSCVLNLKTGTPATTGTQVAPTPDAGFTAMWQITVANGATTVTSPNIVRAPGAPFILEKLNDKGTGGGGNTRTNLVANKTYYVATTGNDSNAGTIGSPWATVQHAIDTIASSVDLSGFNVTIQIADGTYTPFSSDKPFVGGGPQNIIIQGNVSTPSNVVITSASLTASASSSGYGNGFVIQYCKITNTATGGQGLVANNGATIYFGAGMDIGACTLYQVRAALGSRVIISNSYTISGAAANHWASDGSGSIIFVAASITITITGTPAFSDSFALIQQLGELYVSTPNATFSGSATGLNFRVFLNSVIQTQGSATSYLPGNSTGTPATGGQYA